MAVVAVNLHQTVVVDEDFEIKAYYAGHVRCPSLPVRGWLPCLRALLTAVRAQVLGAAMFHIRVGDQSVVYTGTSTSSSLLFHTPLEPQQVITT